MSDTASTRATRNTPDRPLVAAPDLLSSLVPLLAEWVPRQRWFAGKGRLITGFTLVSATELLPCTADGSAPGLLQLLVRAQQNAPAARTPAADCYQLLLGVHPAPPPQLAPAVIGRPAGGPLRGRTVYDALLDNRLCGLLLERLRMPGRIGAMRFCREPDSDIPSGLPGRPIAVEQSNSSIVYGDTFILKVFRRIAPGINPDLELPRALADVKCARVPAPAAWFEAETAEEGGEATTLGVLQPFLPGSADGWQLALNALSVRADFTSSARALGHATAEVHTALAQTLPTTELRHPQLAAIAARMNERLDATARAVPVLQPYRARLRTAFDALATVGQDGRSWAAQRIHGDLHLGQTLRSAEEGRWSLIDFEGEPARPLAERRRPHPALRDVAAMLRSFDYAARSGPAGGDGWSLEWARRTRAAYCLGYAEAGGLDPRSAPELMRAYETDKAVYEVLYEARHRPDWLPVPMAAIRRLAAGGERPEGVEGMEGPAGFGAGSGGSREVGAARTSRAGGAGATRPAGTPLPPGASRPSGSAKPHGTDGRG
ncbi:maltokinase N-terminal cap-like domain-containing protein [Streptomyces piniterrae]|uniref:maltokinase N-terminal cap-like domain-containing protein n=1 Tax=Streptomyces piniterrae TaxID=2571125 RepID=UPI001FEAF94D|nr:maltokinase [Streptomyces piniterrae]